MCFFKRKASQEDPYLEPLTKWCVIMDPMVSSPRIPPKVNIFTELAKSMHLLSFRGMILELIGLFEESCKGGCFPLYENLLHQS